MKGKRLRFFDVTYFAPQGSHFSHLLRSTEGLRLCRKVKKPLRSVVSRETRMCCYQNGNIMRDRHRRNQLTALRITINGIRLDEKRMGRGKRGIEYGRKEKLYTLALRGVYL